MGITVFALLTFKEIERALSSKDGRLAQYPLSANRADGIIGRQSKREKVMNFGQLQNLYY